MNFDWSPEQAAFRDSVRRFAESRNARDTHARRALRGEHGFDRAGWAALGELGVLALPFAEGDGGLGGGPVDLIAVAEPLGVALAVDPFSDALAPAAAILNTAPAAVRARFLPAILDGRALPAVAAFDTPRATDPLATTARARATADGHAITGAKCAVPFGAAADLFLVTARLDAGPAVFAVPRDAAGLAVRPWVAADGQVMAELMLQETPAMLAGDAEAILAARDACWLAASAEAVGVAGAMLDDTVGYTKQRTQFGKPLSAFQAIQHRLADAYVKLELARSHVLRAALGGPGAVAAARAYAAEATLHVAHECVQFHGGMGVTDELAIGHGLKRLQVLARLFGGARAARATYAEALAA